VLIVDDNADAAGTLALLLDSVGHDTRVVVAAERALQAVLEFGPDVVFLDLGMPRLRGFEPRATAASWISGLVARQRDRSRDRPLTHPAT
jgi:CheY-like chemotaxis protein